MPTHIIGLGNVFMSDDGFGPYVVRVLEAFYEMPAGVRLLDGGTPGLELASHLDGADAVIVVETISGPGQPGDIQMSRWPDGPLSRPFDEPMRVGVVPEWVATGVTLSRPVRSAIAPVVGLIVAELGRLGYAVRVRETPRQPDTWWERVELGASAAV